MADRVAVLSDGRLRQLGTPSELYREPADAFVADFIGETNFLPAHVLGEDGSAVTVRLKDFGHAVAVPRSACRVTDGEVLVGVRPEHIRIAAPGRGIQARVLQVAYGGAKTDVILDVGGLRLHAAVSSDACYPETATLVSIDFDAGRCRIYSANR